ncbi:MAG: histidine phosphatase family protein, partial [Boseongicola sp.]|nr:histidine phosphatase family protein [Boseongicola sp.]
MTQTLILLRHAKSSWSDPALGDFDRPLNKRGQRDAPRIGRWLAENDFAPTQALCSTARRAKETLEAAAPDAAATYLDSLYLAPPAKIFDTIKSAQSGRLVVVAHNPGIGMIAHHLVSTPPDHPRFLDYPTADTLVVPFDIEGWSALQPQRGTALPVGTT